MIDSDDPAEAGRNLLIYNPRPRGSGVESKRRDLFEVFAVIGTAFGDTEDQRLESLARQAMPGMAGDNRLLQRAVNNRTGQVGRSATSFVAQVLGTEPRRK